MRNGENPTQVKRAELEAKKRALLDAAIEAEKSARTFNYVSQLWFDERLKSVFWAKNEVGAAHTINTLDRLSVRFPLPTSTFTMSLRF